MKKTLFFFALLCSAIVMQAQERTIHWLTFIDTTDGQVGEIDKTGRKVLYGHFVNVVNAALQEKGYKSDIQDFYDTSLSPDNCKKAVKALKCGPDDIIVFYYIGHGTHAQDDPDDYPQMLLGCGWDQEEQFVRLKEVHEQFLEKDVRARLIVTIGMCCNVVQSASAKGKASFSVNYGNTYMSDTERKAIQNMFLGYKGDFLLSSASKGQSSLGGPTPLGEMDLFTAVLVTCFEDMAYAGELGWESLFSEVKSIVNEVTGGRQTPMFTPNVTKSPFPSDTKQTKPVNTPGETLTGQTTGGSSSQQQRNNDEVLNVLSNNFDYIVDTRIDEVDRYRTGQEVLKAFADGALIKVIGKDGNKQVDLLSATQFIGRISTSRILTKVVPVSYKLNNKRQITMLEVREFYKKK